MVRGGLAQRFMRQPDWSFESWRSYKGELFFLERAFCSALVEDDLPNVLPV